MLEIYTMSVNEIDFSDICGKLSQKRAKKLEKMKSESARRQSIAAELVLNRAIGETFPDIKTPVVWDYDEYGKPYLTEHSGVYINISHSGDYAVCAVSDTPVGVDIQLMRECNLNIAKRYLTAEELEYVNGAKERFYEVWVRKESFSKAVGKGLQLPLKKISVLGSTVSYEDKIYKLQMCDTYSDYKMCVCTLLR